MAATVPASFHFRWLHPIASEAELFSGKYDRLPARCRLPFLGSMDSRPEWAEVRMAWNIAGLAFEWEVIPKGKPVVAATPAVKQPDGADIWIDTRDTRNIQRATRFCQHWRIDVANADGEPSAVTQPIPRALENAPPVDVSRVRLLRTALDEDGDPLPPGKGVPLCRYRMLVLLPASALPGFDVETNRKLGFHYRLRDGELGVQSLAAAEEFPYWENPSLWPTIELTAPSAQPPRSAKSARSARSKG